MKTLIIGKKVVKVYDSIDDMPIVNFQKYNKYLLIDSGIGSDADDIDAHIIKIAKFINSGDKAKALTELQNMRQNMFMITSEISPKYLAFAALIFSVDGKQNTDLSDDSLKLLLDELKDVKHSSILDFLVGLKKKVTFELETYFPDDFVNPKEKDTYDKLKNRTLLVLDSVISGNDNSQHIERIDSTLFGLYSPKLFLGSDSIEVKYDKQFESACLLIAQKANLSAKNMTVLEFYNALSLIKQQAENEARKVKHNKR